MNNCVIRSYKNNRILFSGNYPSVTECIEDAITLNVDLSFADFRNLNLSNGNFDGAYMPGSLLTGCNLTGANLSESHLRGCEFSFASLYNTCLCYSDLSYCDFLSTTFGATDIAGADIRHCQFTTLSCFDLDFWNVRDMDHCAYITPDGVTCEMSSCPVIIKGLLHTPIILMDTVAKIGSVLIPREDIPAIASFIEWHASENCDKHLLKSFS